MEDGFALKDTKIAIVGLGLMGGSLALALQNKVAVLYGIDSDPATLELALAKGIVDQADRDPARLLPQADIIILATPVPAIIDVIQNLPTLTENASIIMDLGSTKRDIVQTMSLLPERFDPIGGHPVCGKEKPGLENAEAALFQGAPFVVTLLKRTTPRARAAAKQIVSEVGAQYIEMPPEEHDRALAFTSHLPFLIASGLVAALPQESASLIGTGFRSTARVAGSPSSMMLGVLQSNRENILKAIQEFRASLDDIASAMQSENYALLESLLKDSRSAYLSLVSNS
ncbi:MAG TPA: prephenate dehydrogenase/arogenate dehydrogenase family protein [Anaerolineales bacterium]|nr:prephenate dehydrogenase/arogenate dehydrogenase family protein [Anaerolineales bacterium]